MNEQFVVFKNSEKLKLFCDTWEQLYLRSADGDIWAYAEGVEMGMSMAVSTMKSLYIPYHYMTLIIYCGIQQLVEIYLVVPEAFPIHIMLTISNSMRPFKTNIRLGVNHQLHQIV